MFKCFSVTNSLKLLMLHRFSWHVNIPDCNKSIPACAHHLLIIARECNCSDWTGVSSAVDDELAGWEVVQSQDTSRSTHSKVFIWVRDCYRIEFVCFSLVRTAFKNCLCICLSEIPIWNLSFLANADEFIIIHWCNTEAIDSSHTLLLSGHSLLCLQIPA